MNLKPITRALCALALIFHSTAFAAKDLDQAARLRTLIKEAQKAWDEAAVAQAQMKFKEVAQLTHERAWSPAEREAIFFAHIRLAQTSETFEERDDWLEIASLNFPDIEIDKEVFPPHLVSSYNRIKRRLLADDDWTHIQKPKDPTLIDRAKKNWFWVGLGVVATGLAVSHYHEEQLRNQSPRPVHRTGF